MGTNGASLSLAKLDELIDKVSGGKPALLLMSRRSRRSLNILARTTGSFLEADRDEFGHMLQFYDGVPIGLNDYIADAQTVGTSADCSVVYAMQFGEGAAHRPHCAGRPHGRTRRQPGDEGRLAHPREVVREHRALQHGQGGEAHGRPRLRKRAVRHQRRGLRISGAPLRARRGAPLAAAGGGLYNRTTFGRGGSDGDLGEGCDCDGRRFGHWRGHGLAARLARGESACCGRG